MKLSQKANQRVKTMLTCVRIIFLSVAIPLLSMLSLSSRAETAIPTETMLNNFFGVNLHLDNCCQGGYEDLNRVAAEIKYIGARELRDWTGTHKGLLKKWQKIHRDTGLQFYASIPNGSPAYQRATLSVMREWLRNSPGMISAIEGSNEPDMPYSVENGASLLDSAELQAEVYAVGNEAGVKVIQMSVGANWKAPLWEGNYKNFGKPLADLGNAHVYMTPAQPPSEALSRIGKLASWSVDGKKVSVTEFGVYKTSIQDDNDVSAFMHIAPFASYILGHASLSVYALHDDMSGVVGFYNKRGEKRLFADYWHVTTRLLADPSGKALPPKDIGLSISSSNGVNQGVYGVKYVPMYKSDGSIWIAIYNEQKLKGLDEDALIEFNKNYDSIRIIDGRNGKVVNNYSNEKRINMTLPANHLYFIVSM